MTGQEGGWSCVREQTQDDSGSYRGNGAAGGIAGRAAYATQGAARTASGVAPAGGTSIPFASSPFTIPLGALNPRGAPAPTGKEACPALVERLQ